MLSAVTKDWYLVNMPPVHPRWRICLGDEVRIIDQNGNNATPRLRKIRAVIAVLVCASDHKVERRQLIDLLWSDRGADQARASLRQCLWTIRTELPDLIDATDGEVWLSDSAIAEIYNNDTPASLSQLSGIDPAFDRWLAGRNTVTPNGADPTLSGTIFGDTTQPRRLFHWKLAAVPAAVALAAFLGVQSYRPPPAVASNLVTIGVSPFTAEPATPAARAIAGSVGDEIYALLPADRAVVQVDREAGGGQRSGGAVADWIISGRVEDGAGKVHVEISTAKGRQIWGRDVEVGQGGLGDAATIAGTRVAMATGCALGGPRVDRDVDVLSLLFAACERLDFSADNYSHETALVALQRLADRAPNDALAQAYFGTGLAVSAYDMPPTIARLQRTKAVRLLDRAQSLDARVGEAWIGRYALVEDDHAYALKEGMLAKGLAVEPTNPTLNMFMGAALAEVGRGDEGLVFEQRALALAPAYLKSAQLAAGMLSAADRPREAIALLDITDRRFPANASQAWQRLDALLTSGDTRGARALLDRANDIQGFLEPEREAAKRRLTYAMDDPSGTLAKAVVRDAIAEADAMPQTATRNFTILNLLGRTDAALAVALRHRVDSAAYFRLQSRAILFNSKFPILARRVGLWDYWEQSGHWPDVCRDRRLQWRCGAGVKSASIAG